jgi:hypothetical protein
MHILYSPPHHDTKYWEMCIPTTTDNRQRKRLVTNPQSRQTGRRKSWQWHLLHTLKTLTPGRAPTLRWANWQSVTHKATLASKFKWQWKKVIHGHCMQKHLDPAHGKRVLSATVWRNSHEVHTATCIAKRPSLQYKRSKAVPARSGRVCRLSYFVARYKVPGLSADGSLQTKAKHFLTNVAVELVSSSVRIAHVAAWSPTGQLSQSHKRIVSNALWRNT